MCGVMRGVMCGVNVWCECVTALFCSVCCLLCARQKERWDGATVDMEAAQHVFGADHVHTVSDVGGCSVGWLVG